MKTQKNHSTSRKIEDYTSIVGEKVVEEIKQFAQRLQGEEIIMLNSTPAGGGVAEILMNLVIILNNLGLKVGWRILKGPETFFQVTKSFHNGLQGENIRLSEPNKQLYEQVNAHNSLMTHIAKHDLVVVHDPQPLPMVNYYKKRIPWIWRCHIDLSRPNQRLLKYLKPFIEQYDAMIVSCKDYQQKTLDIKQLLIAPSIDPLSVKNKPMPPREAKKILRKQEIPLNKPIISQISRFDKWKDPVGVIKVFEIIKKQADCHLVLMGNMAADDPEGPEIYKEVIKRVNKNPDITILLNCSDNDRTVNALQTISHVVLQKSLKEGFALTVSEALWKGTPVVGTRVGGIPLQIINGQTGFLVKNNQEAAVACLKLLKDAKLRKRLGQQGKERVRKNFLITRHVFDYLKLFDYYLNFSHRFNIGRDYPYHTP